MLIIRKEQFDAFDQSVLAAFEEFMVGHLRGFAPRLSELLGEPALRGLIRAGVRKAKAHEMTYRGPVLLYIELMVMFGSEFDVDPLLHWPRKVLAGSTDKDQMHKADRLHAAAMAYLNQVIGPKDAYWIEALRNLDRATIEGYRAPGDDSERDTITWLNSIYPRKCANAGEPALQALVRRGSDLTKLHSADAKIGVPLFVALPFVLGHGFVADPAYPWIAGALQDPAISDPQKRVEKLYARSRNYLREALIYLERS